MNSLPPALRPISIADDIAALENFTRRLPPGLATLELQGGSTAERLARCLERLAVAAGEPAEVHSSDWEALVCDTVRVSERLLELQSQRDLTEAAGVARRGLASLQASFDQMLPAAS